MDFHDASGYSVDDDDDGSVNNEDSIRSIREAVVIEFNGWRDLIAHRILSRSVRLSQVFLCPGQTGR
ncbi:MAG TPA: hypothetical protein VJY34_04500 [Roseiarcus sp.]|nr:hypothetical protein [Roseiarcus sp.]